jgi:hypothetical protein
VLLVVIGLFSLRAHLFVLSSGDCWNSTGALHASGLIESVVVNWVLGECSSMVARDSIFAALVVIGPSALFEVGALTQIVEIWG